MKFKSIKWMKTIAAALAAICLAESSQTVKNTVSADSNTEKSLVKLDEKLGVEPGAIVAELSAHEKDGYYLGTPYDSSPFTAENCMRPNGKYNGMGGMNCTGFVASVMEACGADLSGIDSRGYGGGKINAVNWYHWMLENSVEYYHYNSVDELLAGGKAQKGDVIYFNPIDWESPGADCHIGFFWGNSGKENVFWHSATKPKSGNQISELMPKSPSTVYLFKITHTGTLEIKKESAQPHITKDNRCYSLSEAEFTLYPKGSKEVTAIIKTDKNGYGKVEGIAEGVYEVRETKAPTGYMRDDTVGNIEVKTGKTTVYHCSDTAKRGNIEWLIQKCDAETKKCEPQGSASLAGAEFTVCYYDVIEDKNPADKGEKPLRTWIFSTDETGKVCYSEEYRMGGDELYQDKGDYVLPIGTITIQETSAPAGYICSKEIITRSIKEDKDHSAEVIDTYQTAEVSEDVMRGDLELIKVEDGTLKRMSQIPFKITSKTTGESHVIVTDHNGYASTAADWIAHTQNTNEGKTSEDGIWFGKGEPDDERGALIYDTYLIEEMECENNSGHILIPPFEVKISKNNYRVDLGTVTNDVRSIPQIRTTAIDQKTGGHQAFAGEETVIVDTVYYENLVVGREYKVKGVLIDAQTGEPLQVEGKEITAETTFQAEQETGSVEMIFTWDASDMKGRTIVVFETMYYQERVVAVHEDLSDEGQTIQFPDMTISTKAKDKDSQTQTGEPKKEAIILDTVSYKNLIPGFEYTVCGRLMEKHSGEPLVQSGKEITATCTFTPRQASGAIELEFHLDASDLEKKSVVVYEKLYQGDMLIAVHEDLDDEAQTVVFEKKIVDILPRAKKEKTKVKTGDYSNLAVVGLSLLLSCVVIVKCVKIAYRK